LEKFNNLTQKKNNDKLGQPNLWVYNWYDSFQADSKLPASISINQDYSMVVMHDDFENTGWGVSLLRNNDDDQDLFLNSDNLDIYDAWKIYEKITGNNKVIVRENANKLISINDWISEHPEHASEKWIEMNPLSASFKLKNLKKTGLFETNYNSRSER
jgi:hypothetical protein